MAAVAPVLFPEMKERGAKPGDLVALLSASGAQNRFARQRHVRLGGVVCVIEAHCNKLADTTNRTTKTR